jgi:Carboxypeptidase regulatory-like domain
VARCRAAPILTLRAEILERLLHDGRVVDPEGFGVSDAIVAVVRGTAPTPEIGIRSDADGRFRIALPLGDFEIEARAPDGRTGRASVTSLGEPLPVKIFVFPKL